MKSKLHEEIKKSQTTIMIGAIVCIEKRFGYLFGQDKRKNLTEEEIELKKIFLKLRSDILYLGNEEMKKIDKELDKYHIKGPYYKYDMNVSNYGEVRNV